MSKNESMYTCTEHQNTKTKTNLYLPFWLNICTLEVVLKKKSQNIFCVRSISFSNRMI